MANVIEVVVMIDGRPYRAQRIEAECVICHTVSLVGPEEVESGLPLCDDCECALTFGREDE